MKTLFIFLFFLSLETKATLMCVTTLFAPVGHIDSVNDEILTSFDINLSHFVIDEKTIRFYGPQDPTSLSSRDDKPVLISTHEIIKIDETTYNLAVDGKPLIRSAHTGNFWKFAFDVDFYKQYEPRAYDSILSGCLSAGRELRDCKQWVDNVFFAYVSAVSAQGCVEF